eukprot:CAMPEP_0113906106 /NCGR_PEP_ID=MMETSP0780_2-20120614/24514_1 /TAXON_ID=652834 /ORGANISM="Palpitomonas bilix" /LENGTH=258 /DNA_ID=CAMNT_0000900571 /DNA_START=1 /DNA_END=777 /DNA_ORIENTATION=- /assembly_acc=CAM_ASM_000599
MPVQGQPLQGQAAAPLGPNQKLIKGPDGQQQVIDMPPIPEDLMQLFAMTERLHVKQHIEELEAFIGYETKNKYSIMDMYGRQVAYAAEQSECFERQMCGNWRSFSMPIVLPNGQTAFTLQRPLKCEPSCIWFCLLQELHVLRGNGSDGIRLGSIYQEYSLFQRWFKVCDGNGNLVYRIKGPCCHPWTFRIMDVSGQTELGRISKKWSGFVQELFTDADNFNVVFPADSTPEIRATLMGGLFLIDYLYFENNCESDDFD